MGNALRIGRNPVSIGLFGKIETLLPDIDIGGCEHREVVGIAARNIPGKIRQEVERAVLV